MNERRVLNLVLDDPLSLSPAVASRWDSVVKGARKQDVASIVFLAELLGILDRDPAPVFRSSVYTDVDMFGGCDQRWGIKTRHIKLRREIKQAINDSWGHVDVEDDSVSIHGLPAGMFIEWDGEVGYHLEVKVGNVPPETEQPILSLARSLFKKVKCEGGTGSAYQKVRADLRREQKNVGSAGSADSSVSPTPSDLSHTVDALMDQDDDTALGALNRLMRTNQVDEPEVRPGVLRALAEGNNLTRGAIAESMGRLGLTQNVAPLIAALKDGDSTVRENALLSLGRIRDRSAIPAAVACLEDRAEKVRWYALAALSSLATDKEWPAVVDPVVARLDDESRYVRGVAISMVADRADSSLLQPLLARLEDNSDWVRREAVRGLRKLRDRRSAPALIKLLDDPKNYLRGLAAAALAELEDGRAIEPLREALKWAGQDEELRKDLTAALGELGQKA